MPINIDLGDDWVLTTDSHQYILNKRKSKPGGDTVLEAKYFFHTFDGVIKCHFDNKIRLARSKNFSEFAAVFVKYTAEIKAIGEIFREAIKTYNPAKEADIGTED